MTTGLTNYLVSNKEGGENDLIHHVAQEGFLDVITAGPVPPNPSELLLSEKLDSLMARLREKYDYVIVDTAHVEDFVAEGSLKNVMFVLNDTEIKKTYGYSVKHTRG